LWIIVSGTAASFAGLADYFGLTSVPDFVLATLRWITWVLMIILAIRRMSLTTWIVVSMFLGCEIGFSFPEVALSLHVFSGIFLRLIKTIIAPLLFSTLVVGIASHSNLKQVGRMGLKAILYFEVATSLALIIGLAAINLTNAGKGAEASVDTSQVDQANKLLEQKESHDVFLDVFPENIAKAVSNGYVLQVVVFSIIFGISLAQLSDEKKEPMLRFAQGLADVMFKFTDAVMYFAPFAVGGALAFTIASLGFGVLKNLVYLILTLYGAILFFILFVLVPVGLIIRLNFRKFLAAIYEPVAIAFSTATSEAALPKAMENLEKMGIPRKVVAFVLPTGYSFNLDGSTLYLSLSSVFIAQMVGMDLSLGEQIKMVLILMLTSKGVAGVRGATFLILVSTVASLGIDPQKAFIILGVDALMDMGRTSLNVLGNCLATVVVAKWEGEYSDSPITEQAS
jgi:proton glutamate symport protein